MTLKEILLREGKRPQVISDCEALIEAEVGAKSGLGGLAVKGTYAVVKKVKPGIIREAVDHLLDEFVDRLEPFYAACTGQRSLALEPYFKSREGEIADALVGVTDRRADRARNRVIKSAYDKLRPMGIKHTAAAVPGIARLIAKHV